MPVGTLTGAGCRVPSFVTGADRNVDRATVEAFGHEWERFSEFTDADIEAGGREYFADLLPDADLHGARVLDVGCGSGRWTRYLAKRAAFVEAVDPSRAALVAARATAGLRNVRVVHAGLSSLPYEREAFDVIASVGVLHHMPDPAAAIRDLAQLLRSGGRLYLYLYYRLDDRPAPYRAAFFAAQGLRAVISRLPAWLKAPICDLAALTIYLPLVGVATIVKRASRDSRRYEQIPLHYYVGKPWKVIRNDALDRLGTPLERRFSKAEIIDMLRQAGLHHWRFGDDMPRWRVVAERVGAER